MKANPSTQNIFKLSLLGCSAVILLAGCAGVTVTPLKANGKKAVHEAKGLRYYMPKPYLLVVQLPPVSKSESGGGEGGEVERLLPTNETSSVEFSTDEKKGSKSGSSPKPKAPAAAGDKKDAGDSGDGQTTTASASTSDTSFMAANATYQVKLIYLPDMAHPMAMTASTGLFGTSSMKPALQDGWMLTSLDASADSKTAETLTALASIVGSAIGTGTGAAASGSKAAKLMDYGHTLPPTVCNTILCPGLYEFAYSNDGYLTNLVRVTSFANIPDAQFPPPRVHTPKPKK